NIQSILNWFHPVKRVDTIDSEYTKFGDEKECEIYSRNYDNPTDETVGQIQGKVPQWLEGTLIRNGPGILKIGEHTYNHFFDGLAVLHRFHIKDGK
ncbi:unnamed protein product, partial [Allacma fusca]